MGGEFYMHRHVNGQVWTHHQHTVHFDAVPAKAFLQDAHTKAGIFLLDASVLTRSVYRKVPKLGATDKAHMLFSFLRHVRTFMGIILLLACKFKGVESFTLYEQSGLVQDPHGRLRHCRKCTAIRDNDFEILTS